MGIRITKKSIYEDFLNQMFDGDEEKCTEFFYHTTIEGLGLTMQDMVDCPKSWNEAKTFLVAYLAGKESKYG